MEKILVIEDDELILNSVAEFLNLEGYKCTCVNNGLDGVKIAKDEQPDLILCDVNMPGLNGHQVLQNLRSDPRTSTIPFIFLSAMVHRDDLRKGMMLGADDYVTKPFQPDELLKSIRTRLEKHSELKKKADALKDSIALALPHELQTPLVAIIGFAEMLKEKFTHNDDTEALEFSESILQAGLRLNRLIKNFIFYEKLVMMNEEPKLGKVSDGITAVSFNSLNEMAAKVARRFNRVNDLSLTVQDATIEIPLTYFSSVIEELLDNAFKFSRSGTPVTINCNVIDNMCEIVVSDEGRGMSEEQIANVRAYLQFEREKFEQQGMGLGLTISIKIAEIFGGQLNIKSVYGKNTKVKVHLPIE